MPAEFVTPESRRSPSAGQIGPHQAGDPDQRRPKAEHPPAVEALSSAPSGRTMIKLRQGDPEQNGADLQLAKILHRLEIGRDDVGGRKDDEAEAGEQQHQRQQTSPRRCTRTLRKGFAATSSRMTKAVVKRAPEINRPSTRPLRSSPGGCPDRGLRRAGKSRDRRRRGPANRDRSAAPLLVFSCGTPYKMQANISGSATQYCQSIHRHDQWSAYQPSSDAPTFCDSSEFIA